MFHQSVVPFCLFDIHAGELGQAERGSVRDLGEVRGAYLQAQTERIRNAVDEIGDAGDVLPLNLDQALAEGWVSKRVQPGATRGGSWCRRAKNGVDFERR